MSSYPSQPPAPPVYSEPPPKLGPDGLAIASMVCGIVSCVLFCSPILACLVGVPGLVLGCVSKTRTGIRTAGLTCSIIGIAISFLWFFVIAGILMTGAAAGAANP